MREAAPATPPAMKYDESCGLSQGSLDFASIAGGRTASAVEDTVEVMKAM